eukprot:SAG11_NODE_22409_length_406_cov_1.374593_1_plen_28_part_10
MTLLRLIFPFNYYITFVVALGFDPSDDI